MRARVVALTVLLTQFPQIGRATSRPGIRRIVVVPYLYHLDFRPAADEVVVLGFRHAARKPMP